MATPSGYYPNEEEAHFGPPGTGTYGDYDGGGYFSPQQRPPRGQQQVAWGYGGGAPMGPHGGHGFIEDEYVTAFSDEEADDYDSRMSRVQGGNFETHGRAKSLLRHNEIVDVDQSKLPMPELLHFYMTFLQIDLTLSNF